MRYPQIHPDLFLILKINPDVDFSKDFLSKKDFIERQISWILEEDRASSYPEDLKNQIKEDFESYKNSSAYSAKTYSALHLLIQVFSDIYEKNAWSKKKYFHKKSDLVTWQTFYEKIYAYNPETNEKELEKVIGLKIKMFLVAP